MENEKEREGEREKEREKAHVKSKTTASELEWKRKLFLSHLPFSDIEHIIKKEFGVEREKIYSNEFLPPHFVLKPTGNEQRAAVMVILHECSERGATVTLQRRPMTMRNHAGQLSFPGGAFDEECDRYLVDTAFRETQEEVC